MRDEHGIDWWQLGDDRSPLLGADALTSWAAPDKFLGPLNFDEIRRAAQRMGVQLTVVVVKGSDYDGAFGALVAARIQALFVGGHTFFARDGDRIIALAARHRLPATYEWPEQAEDGGLTVSTRVSDPAWLRSLLLRLGGEARVLSPEGAGDSAADAATEALDQYAALAR